MKGNGPSLLGRDWLARIKQNWSAIRTLHRQDATLDEVLAAHNDLFAPGLGTIMGTTAKVHIDSTAKPRFCQPQAIPHALRSRVEEALGRLEKEGIIEPVDFSEWAAPIEPVVKHAGTTVSAAIIS